MADIRVVELFSNRKHNATLFSGEDGKDRVRLNTSPATAKIE